MTRAARLLAAGLLLLALAPPQRTAAAGPPARASRVLLISVDGLRPDVLLRAQAPVMRGLMTRGSYSMWAHTTAVAVTLPSHVSMLTGLTPPHHGIVWNSDVPLARPVYPSRPTLMKLAHEAGLTTAMATGKTKFQVLAEPGTCDLAYVPSDSTMPDDAVTDTTVAWIRRAAPQVLFVHLPGVDTAGHARGWGSAEQLAAVATADQAIGRVLAALARRGVLDSTLVLVTSDHGGAGRGHGPDDPRSRTIPWILCGPGVRAGVDLDTDSDTEIHTEDSFATLAAVLGLDPGGPLDGHPVTTAFTGALH